MDFNESLAREIEEGTSSRGHHRGEHRGEHRGAYQPERQQVDVNICPNAKRDLRACLVCGLIKAYPQFLSHGCENCESELDLKGSAQNITDCTTPNFFGVVAQMQPDNSWVSQWHRTAQFHPGCYALQVEGKLPVDIVRGLDKRGIAYRNPEQYKR